MLVQTLAQAMPERRQTSPESWVTNFFGDVKAEGPGFQSFLVEKVPQSVIKPHFHSINQFQIFVDGVGSLGHTPIQIGVLQYADAYTPYGPITATESGVSFFTLRRNATNTTHFMPGSRDKQLKRAGRQLVGSVDLSAAANSRTREIFSAPDGVSAFELAAQPGGALPAPAAPEHGGAYVVVLRGVLHGDRDEYGPKACIALDAGEALPALTAGAEGAIAAFMSFPRNSDQA